MKGKIVLLMLVVLALSISLVAAAPEGGDTTVGTSGSGTTTEYTNVTIDGGDVTYVDVNSDVVTSKWAGFYGNLSGTLFLSDGTNNFYEWSLSTLTGGVVYAANTTVTDWTGTTIAPMDNAGAPSFVNGAYTDNFTNTFTGSEAFVSASLNEASTPYATTLGAGAFKTYALKSGSVGIWAGLVVENGTSFTGGEADYQILLPAQTSTQYSFYVELP